MEDDVVSISIERLKALEALEANIPKIVDAAFEKYKKTKLQLLHEKEKSNPSLVNLRVKRYIEKNREKINERRRERRRQQKMEKMGTVQKETLVKDCALEAIRETPIIQTAGITLSFM